MPLYDKIYGQLFDVFIAERLPIFSLHFNLHKSQINHLQLIQNFLARVVVKAPKSCHISPVLKSLHWLKINERNDYKICLTYTFLTTTQSSYLHNLILDTKSA